MTQEEMLVKELETNCKRFGNELLDHLKAYDLAVLADDLQEERIKECYNEVLKEHTFLVSAKNHQCAKRLGIEVGERITDDDNAFLMSKDDFEQYNSVYSQKKLYDAGICDEKGYYIVNTSDIKFKERTELVEFIISNIIPASIRGDFWRNRTSYRIQEKLIKIIKAHFK